MVKCFCGKRYCINCGQLIPRISNYCPACGAPQHGQAAGVFRANDPTVQLELGSTVLTQIPDVHDKERHAFKIEGKRFMNKRHLDDAAVISFMLHYTIRTGIVLLFLLAYTYFDPMFGLIFIGVYLILITLFSLLVHNNYVYWLDDTSFHKTYGVLNKHHVAIPYEQVQNVNITRGLLDRILGIARVAIETAGASSDTRRQVDGGSQSSAEGYLPGVSFKEAKILHDVLLSAAKDTE